VGSRCLNNVTIDTQKSQATTNTNPFSGKETALESQSPRPSGAEADLLCADGIAALDRDDEALARVFESEIKLRLPATRRTGLNATAPLRDADPSPVQASVYVAGMSDGTLARSYGNLFNEVAVEYDRNRPTYPDALVDEACEVAGIGDGDRVLEIGCGTGQLTRSLLARELRVTALEPGDQLIGVAEENLKDAGDVELVHARLEDVQLPRESYEAVFSASAIHWVDPDLSWRKLADTLAPGGTLALIQYFGLKEQRSVDDQAALLAALRRHAPEIAATWPTYRDLDCMIAGVQERRRNVADAWAWLGSYDIGRDYAADLFEDLQLATVPTLVEHTAAELGALLATMSFWARLSPGQRDALANEHHALHERLGRPIRASTLAALLTARRSAPASLTSSNTSRGQS
jgi:SAM-dependent methyltransferase